MTPELTHSSRLQFASIAGVCMALKLQSQHWFLIVLIVSTCCLQDCDNKFNLDLEIRARPRRLPASIPLAAKALFSLLFSSLLFSSQPSGGAQMRMPLVFQFLANPLFLGKVFAKGLHLRQLEAGMLFQSVQLVPSQHLHNRDDFRKQLC